MYFYTFVDLQNFVCEERKREIVKERKTMIGGEQSDIC